MRIAVATSARFELLDLAREWGLQGLEVDYYSNTPRWRDSRLGLRSPRGRSFFPYLFPLVGLARYGPRSLYDPSQRLLCLTLDRLVESSLAPCDFLITMSGLFPRTARKARERYGARVFVHRSSLHVLDQLDVLGAEPRTRARFTDFTVRRELRDYETADRIVVNSLNVKESFLRRGTPQDRLFLNPLGVNLGFFPATPKPAGKRPTLLFVGTWCYRKGCDLLAGALERLADVELIHVGPLGDCPLPVSDRFRHVAPVPEWRLKEFYAQAHVFTLPSREDGFGLVLSQGLACGLTVVASRATGARDLLEMTGEKGRIRLTEPGDLEGLVTEIRSALESALEGPRDRSLPPDTAEKLTWRRYASAYHGELLGSAPGPRPREAAR